MCYNKVNASWGTAADNNKNYLKKIRWGKGGFFFAALPMTSAFLGSCQSKDFNAGGELELSTSWL